MNDRLKQIRRAIEIALETPVLSVGQWRAISILAQEADELANHQEAEDASYLQAKEIYRQERD